MNNDVRRSRTAFVWVGLIAPMALLVAAAVAILAWMPLLPDPMAIHWGDDGVNGFASKGAYIPLVLGIGAAVIAMTALLAVFAHRLPQSSAAPAIGPWSSTTRFIGALNLGLAALIAIIGVSGAWIQRGLPDAAQTPGIGIPTLIGFIVMGALAVLGWFVQPPSPATTTEAAPAGSITLTATQRAAWFGTATMARSGVIVLIAALALLALTTVFFLALGEDGSWMLLIVTIVLALTIGAMLVFRVRVNADGLRVRSLLGWPDTRIPLDRIDRVETVQLDPFREFGGWGWRLALDGRRGVVLRAGAALQVTQTDGRVFVVTVDGASAAAATLETLRAHAGRD
ncbi:hypothetical protein Q9R19_03015 [Microbacterium sp. ARD32]|uniref:hypothetical protein n=1 Tax=Microbacterium sp. ARD32 TaxID=2962577 RepID=UPI002882820B|nr:hypothetical protein [Microbacterium sp. ARD32]MDT0156591.1 hypothetical protein [Microbacterium sp. ARD32]